MKPHNNLPLRRTLLGLGLFAAVAVAGSSDGLYEEYCSTENTGSDYAGVTNIYQSNGACYTQCKDGYAFAVLQWQTCWCSNYIPAEQQNVSDCNETCPGYPDDLCGNKAAGLYGYVPLPNKPSGTAGASSSQSSTGDSVSTTSSPVPSTVAQASSVDPATTNASFASSTGTVVPVFTPSSTFTSSSSRSWTLTLTFSSSKQSSTPQSTLQTSSSAPQTSYVSVTVDQTVTQSQSPSILVSYVTPTSSSDSSTSSTTSSTTSYPVATTGSSTSSTLAPVTSIRVITVSGAVVTETVTSTPVVASGSADQLPFQRKSLSGGAIAGVVIGTLLGVAAVAVAALLLYRRRRQNGDAEGASPGGRGRPSPRRNTSVLSKTGLLSRGRPMSMAEKELYDEPYGNGGISSVRHSALFGGSTLAEGVSPVSPLGSSQENVSSRRHSKPMVHDQRLNPSALFAHQDANGSRVSMQDQQDYSRPLGVVNPDLRPSFESRISHE